MTWIRINERLKILIVLCITATVICSIIVVSKYKYRNVVDLNRPLVFIGGMPRSGTTLMRALLDVHSLVRCGEETTVVPKLSSILKIKEKMKRRYEEAHITQKLLNDAIGTAILMIIEGHGKPAQVLCNKDPFTLRTSIELSYMFPNSKFIMMLRDGRAVVHSMISRKVSVSGFNLSDFQQCLGKWDELVIPMYDDCLNLTQINRCLVVKYEELVLHPKKEITRIMNFLDLPFENALLRHHLAVGGEISVSRLEFSTDQIAKPINTDALTNWAKSYPENLKQITHKLAPALKKFDYNPFEFPPNYGTPDPLVANNTNDIHTNPKYWDEISRKFKRISI